MLDRAVSQFPMNVKLSERDAYVAGATYKLFKPHGSVNWAS
jgi:hypothetical protein